MKIYLLHGFNVANAGKTNTDTLVPFLAGIGDIIDLDYGWTGLIGVRLCARKLARLLAKLGDDDSIVVAHSNGCAIASYAVELGLKAQGLVFINPALDHDWIPPQWVRWWRVYHNDRDLATWAAAYIPFHRWGNMGCYGPSSRDSRLTAIDTLAEHNTAGHSGVFKHVRYWGPEIAEAIEEELI